MWEKVDSQNEQDIKSYSLQHTTENVNTTNTFPSLKEFKVMIKFLPN